MCVLSCSHIIEAWSFIVINPAYSRQCWQSGIAPIQLLSPLRHVRHPQVTPSHHPTRHPFIPSPLSPNSLPFSTQVCFPSRIPPLCTPNQESQPFSVTHLCHTSPRIKFTLGLPLSKKPEERQRRNEIERLTSFPGSRAHDRHPLNRLYTHVSGFYKSSCIPKCKFLLKIKHSFKRTKGFLNCWLWEGLYYP